MIISVMSPHTTNNGSTTTALLLAMGLASMKRKVFISHTSERSDAFATYLGLKIYEDRTSTPAQLVKLLREGAINPEDIPDYCKQVVDFLDVFTNTSTNFTSDDMSSLLDFVLDSSTHDFKVIDIDCDLNSKISKSVLKKSGIVVINVSQSILELDKFVKMKQEIMKVCGGKKIVLVCNKFDGFVMKDKIITSKLDLNTRLMVIRRNVFVDWGINSGNLVQVYKYLRLGDTRVYDVAKDVSLLATTVAKLKVKLSTEKRGWFGR